MILESIKINSYKSILKPLDLKLSPTLNIFIGQNNSGKTNILDAVEVVLNPEINPERLNHYRANIELYIKDQLEPVVLHGYEEVINSSALRNSKMIRISDERPVDFQRLDIDYRIMYEKYPHVFRKMQDIMAEYFPQITVAEKSLEMDLGTGRPVINDSEKAILIDRLGSGFRKLLVILLYALHPDYSIVLLDEPETHLHPGLIKRLFKVLASSTSNQIIMTTHSPLFIRPENLQQVFLVVREAESGTRYYSLATSRIKIDRRRLVQEMNADTSEIFFVDKVLLVEGVSDRILMRGLIDRFYHGPLEIKVMETHGKGNIDVYVDILRAFNIPYLVMLDHDALGWWADEFLHQRGIFLGRGKKVETIKKMKQFHIYILSNGNIETNYPRKYQKDKKKPLNALYAANNITVQEFQSSIMKDLRAIIKGL